MRLTAEELARATKHLKRNDIRLAAVIKQSPRWELKRRGNVYHALFRSVLYQQLAGKAAATIERRVYALSGGKPPSPAAFVELDDAALRAAGLSRQKTRYLRELSAHFADGRLDPKQLVRLGDDELIEAVTVVPGIGEWTAHMLLMFSLARPDVLPVGDYGVRKGMQTLYGLDELPKPATMQTIAEPWRPYRSVGSWYMWRVLELSKAE